MHLQIAAVGSRRDDRYRQGRIERESKRVPAQVRAPETPPFLDLGLLGGRVHRGLDCRGFARANQLDDDALARGADERNVTDGSLLDEIDNGTVDTSGQRLCSALVSERASLGALQDREILQQSGGDD